MHVRFLSRLASLALGAAVFAMWPVQAAENGASRAEMSERKSAIDEELIVTADPLQRAEDHLVQPVTVLGGEQLARENVRNIGEVVSQQLGVTAADFGANVGRPVIRGLSGARVRVLARWYRHDGRLDHQSGPRSGARSDIRTPD